MRSLLTRLASPVALGVLAASVPLLAPSEASACGGCFVPPATPTVVSGHRMVMSVSPTQSTLWDQIQYAGEPEEFAWVLPVKPGARIETASSAFFEVLEATTVTKIQQPQVTCGNAGGGLGCGMEAQADSAGFGDGEEGGGDPVEVVHQGTVGPYETVTLSTEEPGALNEWLASHGYAVDATTQPIIDAYVAEGFDFIALRLLPGKGVKEMSPVRVVSAGGGLSLPLRMVAAGTGAQTPIVLYVVGEGRYEVDNFPEARIETALLSWDFETSQSNYAELRKQALAREGGRGFLTTFAQSGLLTQTFQDQNFNPVSFLDLYAQQAFNNGETAELCSVDVGAAGSAMAVVKNPCPPGEPWDSPACAPSADAIDARLFGCEDMDDVATALEGLHPADVWVTRLEADLPREALAIDLLLRAAPTQIGVSSTLQANVALHVEEVCGGGVLPTIRRPDEPPPPKSPWTGFYVLSLGAAALAYAARRFGGRVRAIR
ncbi:MAG: DUF2330 domain-containing protein [Myxococcales bacterium]|nr:DUF2330 domain-containing protein [Myxococcales bacterium]